MDYITTGDEAEVVEAVGKSEEEVGEILTPLVLEVAGDVEGLGEVGLVDRTFLISSGPDPPMMLSSSIILEPKMITG